MFLVNWVESNIMLAIMTLFLIGIPAVITYIAFRKRPAENAGPTASE
ncbi:MAG: hypothetical protein AAFU60_14185 [Bacteroidota bacterium]